MAKFYKGTFKGCSVKMDLTCVLTTYLARDDVTTNVYSFFGKYVCSNCQRNPVSHEIWRRAAPPKIRHFRRQKRMYDLYSVYNMFRYLLSYSIHNIDITDGKADIIRRSMFVGEGLIKCIIPKSG